MPLMKIDEDVLFNYFNNKLTQEEVDLVELWFSESEEHQNEFRDAFTLYKIISMEASETLVDTVSSYANFKYKYFSKVKRINWFQYVKYVAAFFVGVFLTGGLALFLLSDSTKDKVTVFTAQNERASVKLPDGSIVALNSNSQLDYTEKFWSSKRTVSLMGEAYFEVYHNNTPFVVSSKNVDIEVVGTKFNVRANEFEKDVITTLLEGAVCVSSSNLLEEHKLIPGESLRVNTEKGTTKLFSYEIPENILLWRTGKLSFDQTTLLEITQTLEQHFNIEITIDNKNLEQELFTCEFSTQSSICNILEVLSLTNKMKFDRIDEYTIIIKKV